MKRWVHAVLLAGLVVGAAGLAFHPGSRSPKAPVAALNQVTARDVTTAISGLDLRRAERMLSALNAPAKHVDLIRARLALYRGDCDEAHAIMAAMGDKQASEAHEAAELAESCARVVAGSKVVTDEARGVWVRIQDDADESWARLVMDVAARARDVTSQKLGTPLPRPLRIELVLDHASLSALTGLPLEAAETTGTVAIARWGRVSMLSPRSFPHGYPWQDTLAHEITHLLVTAASNDNAPLWLQEALAKHFETAWRPARPLDDDPNLHELTRSAWHAGHGVGIENLGASIALLPSPESARIAYAEVYDFLEFILRSSGWQTLRLLLHDLRDLGADRVDEALVSATGYTQKAWSLRWRVALSNEKAMGVNAGHAMLGFASEAELEVARRARLAELVASRRAWDAADVIVSTLGAAESGRAEVRSIAGLAKLQLGDAGAALHELGTASGLAGLQGDWLALRGRALEETSKAREASEYFDWALAYSPSSERVACRGRAQSDGTSDPSSVAFLDEGQRVLCLAARQSALSAGQPPIE